MVKNYIFGPVELAFEATPYGSLYSSALYVNEMEEMEQNATNGWIVVIGDMQLLYATTVGHQVFFTIDGTIDLNADPPEHFLNMGVNTSVPEEPIAEIAITEPAGTYTVSIYTETDDPEPEPVVNPFSKNVAYNDHPYNAVERIRAKLKQKIDEGEDEEESGGDEGGGTASGGGIFLVNAEIDEIAETATLNKTYKEIIDAFEGGSLPVMIIPDGPSSSILAILVSYSIPGEICTVGFFDPDEGSILHLVCETENDYPVANLGG